MDYLALGAFGAVGMLCGVLITLFLIYRLKSSYLFEGIIENLIQDLSNDEEMQKSIYLIGGTFANGVKGGLQITRSGGRMNIKNIAMDLIGQFIEKKATDFLNSPSSPLANPSSPSPQDTLTKKPTVNW